MRDVNYPLRKAYVSALAGLQYNSIAVPVFYPEAPPDYVGNYIVLSNVSNNDGGTKYKSSTSTAITVNIYTYDSVSNSGRAADDIASEVLTRIYPDRQTHLDLSADNLQCVTTELSNDNTQDYGQTGERKYIDRVLTFRHVIFQR